MHDRAFFRANVDAGVEALVGLVAARFAHGTGDFMWPFQRSNRPEQRQQRKCVGIEVRCDARRRSCANFEQRWLHEQANERIRTVGDDEAARTHER